MASRLPCPLPLAAHASSSAMPHPQRVSTTAACLCPTPTGQLINAGTIRRRSACTVSALLWGVSPSGGREHSNTMQTQSRLREAPAARRVQSRPHPTPPRVANVGLRRQLWCTAEGLNRCSRRARPLPRPGSELGGGEPGRRLAGEPGPPSCRRMRALANIKLSPCVTDPWMSSSGTNGSSSSSGTNSSSGGGLASMVSPWAASAGASASPPARWARPDIGCRFAALLLLPPKWRWLGRVVSSPRGGARSALGLGFCVKPLRPFRRSEPAGEPAGDDELARLALPGARLIFSKKSGCPVRDRLGSRSRRRRSFPSGRGARGAMPRDRAAHRRRGLEGGADARREGVRRTALTTVHAVARLSAPSPQQAQVALQQRCAPHQNALLVHRLVPAVSLFGGAAPPPLDQPRFSSRVLSLASGCRGGPTIWRRWPPTLPRLPPSKPSGLRLR